MGGGAEYSTVRSEFSSGVRGSGLGNEALRGGEEFKKRIFSYNPIPFRAGFAGDLRPGGQGSMLYGPGNPEFDRRMRGGEGRIGRFLLFFLFTLIC